MENHTHYDNFRIASDNWKQNENVLIQIENNENQENHRIPHDNYENYENSNW